MPGPGSRSPDRKVLSLAGRAGAYRQHALHDPRETTAKARRAFLESFLEGHACAVCPPIELPAELPHAERLRRAEVLRLAHLSSIALHRHRTKKAPGNGTMPGASAEGHGSDRPASRS